MAFDPTHPPAQGFGAVQGIEIPVWGRSIMLSLISRGTADQDSRLYPKAHSI